MSLAERIKQIADIEGITIFKIEREIGASKGVLSRAYNKNTDIQSKWVSKIVEKYQHKYNALWIVTGIGDKLKTKENNRINETGNSNSISGGMNFFGVNAREVSISDASNEEVKQMLVEKDEIINELRKEINRLSQEIKSKNEQIGKLIGML